MAKPDIKCERSSWGFDRPGIGSVLGAAIGALVGSYIGTIIPVYQAWAQSCIKGANKQKNNSDDNSVSPFIKEAKVAFSMGSSIGALGGSFLGSSIPVIGTVLGGLAGSFLGGSLGIAIAYIAHCLQPTTLDPKSPQIEIPIKSKENESLNSVDLCQQLQFSNKCPPFTMRKKRTAADCSDKESQLIPYQPSKRQKIIHPEIATEQLVCTLR